MRSTMAARVMSTRSISLRANEKHEHSRSTQTRDGRGASPLSRADLSSQVRPTPLNPISAATNKIKPPGPFAWRQAPCDAGWTAAGMSYINKRTEPCDLRQPVPLVVLHTLKIVLREFLAEIMHIERQMD